MVSHHGTPGSGLVGHWWNGSTYSDGTRGSRVETCDQLTRRSTVVTRLSVCFGICFWYKRRSDVIAITSLNVVISRKFGTVGHVVSCLIGHTGYRRIFSHIFHVYMRQKWSLYTYHEVQKWILETVYAQRIKEPWKTKATVAHISNCL